ncbi:ATP-dependent Clp protease adapter protein CLPS2, chloroplastic [Physcomitrium patens]|uniref:Adaptor protein ClpS core domain-containing protein n=1 Tax=Physcomitrium patens TaxID=3218 RepID=A0A2K1KKE3_PHYPA|nr:uncharacterized protein LOC112282086 [Physcomitrium patens]PNR54250.1 hypothetical protein PHYPA_007927 [Physcomitrium patens]|eukprot:XP_024375044.1 uncharacterized protein LOC112282086 [Physcomitrella patens]
MAAAMGSAAQVMLLGLQPVGAVSQAAAPVCVRVAVGQQRDTRGTVGGSGGVFQARLGGGGGGAGVLERPKLDQSGSDTTPRTEEGGESGRAAQRNRTGGGERYRVLLLDHERHTETYVAKALTKAVPNITAEQARKCFFESRLIGKSVVMVAVKEHAEMHAFSMARYGLRSTIEPDGSVM